jgi:hypothetical protein
MDTQDPRPNADPANPTPRCGWCSAPVPSGAARCPSCGASLEEIDPVAGSAIPGVTVVDPEVARAEQQAASDQARARGDSQIDRIAAISGPKATFGGGLIRAAFGLAKGIPDDDGGRMFGLIGRIELGGSEPPLSPRLDIPVARNPEGAPDAPEVTAADTGDGAANDPWRDLPPASLQEQVTGTEWDPWAPRTQAEDAAAAPFDPWADRPDPWSAGTPQDNDPWAVDGGLWSQHRQRDTELTEPKNPGEGQ